MIPKKIEYLTYILAVIMFCSPALLLVHSILYTSSKSVEATNNCQTIEEIHSAEPTMSLADSIKMLIAQMNIAHPDIVFAQAILETGNFKSDVFRENNNLFGMRQALSRPHTQTGMNIGYAVYPTWQLSVIDYAINQAWSAKRLSREQYIEYLRTTYATDSTYIDNLKIERK